MTLRIFIFLLLLSACGLEPSSTTRMSSCTSKVVSVSWEQVGPLFQAKCVSCHNSTLKQDGVDLSTYTSAKQAASLLPGSLPSMPPPSPLAAAEAKLVTDWIAAGLLETSTSTSPSAPTETCNKK